MAVGAITKQSVDRLKPRLKNGRLVEDHLWDPKLSGFGVKVTPPGAKSERPYGAKSYLVQYRIGGRGSPTKRVTIGPHGAPWTPAQAREEADRVLRLVKKGIDPQEQKKAQSRQAVELAFDKYAKHFLDQYGARTWGARTLVGNRRHLASSDSPALIVFGSKPLPQIKRSDIAAVFDRVPAERGGYARNIYSALRRLFSWAVERGDIERSPFEGFKGPAPVAARDRVLDDAELRLVWLASFQLEYPFGPFYRFLIATGQRREEVAALTWRELDRAKGEWLLPAGRSKNKLAHVVPLNAIAVAELDKIAGGEEWPNLGLVFTTTGKTPISGYSRGKQRFDEAISQLSRKEAGEAGEPLKMEPWRLHDIRRTFATGMQRLGVRFEVTEAALNHVSGSRSGVAGIYQRHDWHDEKRTALDLWGQHLVLIQCGLDFKSAGKIVELIAKDLRRVGQVSGTNVVALHA